MGRTQPFIPDDLYCAYCHAIAAGPCASCGALCCGGCVELVMGLTTRRAVCRPCVQAGRRPAGSGMRAWLVVALIGLAAVFVLLLV